MQEWEARVFEVPKIGGTPMPWPDRCAWYAFQPAPQERLEDEDGKPVQEQPYAVFIPVCEGGASLGPGGCYCDEYKGRARVTVHNLRAEVVSLQEQVEALRADVSLRRRENHALRAQLRAEQGRRVPDLVSQLRLSREQRLLLMRQQARGEHEHRLLREGWIRLEQEHPELAAEIARMTRVSCGLCGWAGVVRDLRTSKHGHCPKCGEHL